MVPTLPFIFLIVAIALSDFVKTYFSIERSESRNSGKTMKQFNNNSRQARIITINGFVVIFILINILFATSYFITAFVRPDTRVEAYHFAQQTIPVHAPILSELYDLGIVPFNQTFTDISLFHFYDLDTGNPAVTPEHLSTVLQHNEYLVLPSPRLLKTRLYNENEFPQGHAFYQALFDERLGYEKIYETPCDLFCQITYLGDPVFQFEQTASVFDRPTVLILKKSSL